MGQNIAKNNLEGRRAEAVFRLLGKKGVKVEKQARVPVSQGEKESGEYEACHSPAEGRSVSLPSHKTFSSTGRKFQGNAG